MAEDDDRLRGVQRWRVTFSGKPEQSADAALRDGPLFDLSGPAGAFWPAAASGPSEWHYGVGVLAPTEDDAIAKVREVLDGHGEFDGFEAEELAPEDDEPTEA